MVININRSQALCLHAVVPSFALAMRATATTAGKGRAWAPGSPTFEPPI